MDNMKDKKLPVLIFDWDGVIVDSNAWKWEGAWDEVFQAEPKLAELMQEILLKDIEKKLTRIDLVNELFNKISGEDYPKYTKEEYISRFGQTVRGGVVRIGLFPEAKAVLRTLHESGYRMYVISATSKEDLDYLSKELGVGKFFIEIYGSPGKKIEHAQNILKNDDNDTQYIVIGDGEGDRKLAVELNSVFVGVTNQWNNWENDNSLKYSISHIGQVHNILKRIT